MTTNFEAEGKGASEARDLGPRRRRLGKGDAEGDAGAENYFRADVAARYDAGTADMPVEPVVAFLAELAGEGAALELGIGTGRIALPLAQRAVLVRGIDLSPDMVAKLREKPGAEAIGVTIGDFATTRVEGTFTLVYLVFNTILNLTTQEAQVACFENAAAHLEPGGCFVIEVGVGGGSPLQVFSLGESHVGIAELDPVPLGLARRARPDGPPRGDASAGALGRLGARAVHC